MFELDAINIQIARNTFDYRVTGKQNMIEIPSSTSAPQIKTDALTGLVSRVGLESYLYQREGSPDKDQALSIMSVEISRFGSVNDSMGAELGNKIIAMVAKRIQKLFGHAT